MAKHVVEKAEIGSYENRLLADTVDTVEFAANLPAVEVVKEDEGAAIYFKVDPGEGGPPTVRGQDCYQIPAGVRAVRIVLSRTNIRTIVQLISEGTPSYGVCEVSDR